MTYPNVPWTLKPGDTIQRKALQETYGGRTQGGIGPSRSSANVLIFSDPVSGERHGYVDGWAADRLFHYTGEGQRGDQRMLSGNASIYRHKDEGRALRVFLGASGTVTYLGEFELDDEQPYYETDAPETNDGPVRKVIVFRLRPVDIPPGEPSSRYAELAGATVTTVAIEEQWTEKVYVEPAREPIEAERREAKLVLEFRDYLRTHGNRKVSRLRILPPGEAKPLFTDLFIEGTSLLIEAKGTTTRESVRMAIGQLVDYARFVPGCSRAILLPSRPREDLLALAREGGAHVIWPQDGIFIADVMGLI